MTRSSQSVVISEFQVQCAWKNFEYSADRHKRLVLDENWNNITESVVAKGTRLVCVSDTIKLESADSYLSVHIHMML